MKESKTVHEVFKTITILKGIHAILETLLGVMLFILSKEIITQIINIFIKLGIVGSPNWFIAQYITQFGIDLSLSIKLFFAIYLVTHGVVNLSLVYGIIKKPSIAYPISLVVFVGFLIYQIFSFFSLFSVWMFLIILFDVLFIVLLFYEYSHHLESHSFLGRLKLIATAKVPSIVKVEIKIPKILPVV